jgi:hypothetical protein
MTYRELINNLSDEEFAQAIIDDAILHMSCSCSVEGNTKKCPYEIEDCLKCVVKFLKSDIENIDEI